jgi:hypothetical protein
MVSNEWITSPQATEYQSENFKRPKGLGIKPSSAAGGLKTLRWIKAGSVMKEALIVAIVFGSLVLIPAVIGGTIVLSIRFLKGGGSRKDQAEDSKIIQEIYKGLSRMEERVEALETILLDRDKEGS